MKSKILTLLSVVLLLSVVTSCFLGPSVSGNGNVLKEQREINSFEVLRVSSGLNVYLTQGDRQKIIVEADENLLDYIETEVNDNRLNITTSAIIRSSNSLKVFVTITDLSEIHATAGSNVYSESKITCNDFDISGSAGSNIKLEINGEDIKVSALAGSNITLTGKADDSKLKASAGSNIKAEELNTDKCDARANSGANIWIKVTNEFDGRAGSGGNVFYYGNPKITTIEKSSGGNVIQRNLAATIQ